MIDINPNKQNQQTIRETILISGTGSHSGKQVQMKLVKVLSLSLTLQLMN